MSSKLRFYALHIDGQWVDSASRRWIDVMNPAFSKLLGKGRLNLRRAVTR